MCTDQSGEGRRGTTTGAADPGPAPRRLPEVPAPLSPAELVGSPGVLGNIARERAADYVDAATAYDEAVFAQCRRAVAQRRSFKSALQAVHDDLAIIAEVKRASPSQGAIADVDPVSAAREYWEGGAACLSVLTEPRHFGGQLEHLRAVAGVVPLPLLRKEFTVHPAQVVEAALSGASAVLLIVALLGERTAAYLSFARRLGLDVLVEVHDEDELEIALQAGTDLLGVNNRNLKTLKIDLATAPALIRRARAAGFEGVAVAESGYRTAHELHGLRGVADAVLVGTSLVASGNLREALRGLRAQ